MANTQKKYEIKEEAKESSENMTKNFCSVFLFWKSSGRTCIKNCANGQPTFKSKFECKNKWKWLQDLDIVDTKNTKSMSCAVRDWWAFIVIITREIW